MLLVNIHGSGGRSIFCIKGVEAELASGFLGLPQRYQISSRLPSLEPHEELMRMGMTTCLRQFGIMVSPLSRAVGQRGVGLIALVTTGLRTLSTAGPPLWWSACTDFFCVSAYTSRRRGGVACLSCAWRLPCRGPAWQAAPYARSSDRTVGYGVCGEPWRWLSMPRCAMRCSGPRLRDAGVEACATLLRGASGCSHAWSQWAAGQRLAAFATSSGER